VMLDCAKNYLRSDIKKPLGPVGLGEGRARRLSRRVYDGDLVGAPRKYYF